MPKDAPYISPIVYSIFNDDMESVAKTYNLSTAFETQNFIQAVQNEASARGGVCFVYAFVGFPPQQDESSTDESDNPEPVEDDTEAGDQTINL
jgi:hypothetical protein